MTRNVSIPEIPKVSAIVALAQLPVYIFIELFIMIRKIKSDNEASFSAGAKYANIPSLMNRHHQHITFGVSNRRTLKLSYRRQVLTFSFPIIIQARKLCLLGASQETGENLMSGSFSVVALWWFCASSYHFGAVFICPLVSILRTTTTFSR